MFVLLQGKLDKVAKGGKSTDMLEDLGLLALDVVFRTTMCSTDNIQERGYNIERHFTVTAPSIITLPSPKHFLSCLL